MVLGGGVKKDGCRICFRVVLGRFGDGFKRIWVGLGMVFGWLSGWFGRDLRMVLGWIRNCFRKVSGRFWIDFKKVSDRCWDGFGDGF